MGRMLDIQDCCLVIIDVQGKLAELMHGSSGLFRNICILIEAAKILDIPIIWCQQSPKALGVTVPQIAKLLTGTEPVNKTSFSCCGHEQFNEKLKTLNRRQVLLCGIEAHVCVYQTAVDLLEKNYAVSVIADAVSSRMPENKQIGLERIAAEGAKVGSTEMILFELLKTAEHPAFRQIAKLVK